MFTDRQTDRQTDKPEKKPARAFISDEIPKKKQFKDVRKNKIRITCLIPSDKFRMPESSSFPARIKPTLEFVPAPRRMPVCTVRR